MSPPDRSLHREDGRNELRVNRPKDRREKTLMLELENLGKKKRKEKRENSSNASGRGRESSLEWGLHRGLVGETGRD